MSDAFDSTIGWLAAGLAEVLAHIRGAEPSMPTKYQYPATNTSLQNEGLALINLSEEMTAYYGGTLPSGGGGASVPTSVSVLPTLPSMTALNQTLQFTAVVKDQNNNILTPGVNAPALVWSSSNTTSATVDPVSGLATETGNGQTIITAMCGNRGGGTTLTTSGAATPVPTTVTISPASANLTSNGAQQQFTATVLDQNSNPLTPGSGGIPALVWSSLNTSVATINSSSGLATEVGNGSATIKCTCGSAGGTATLNCSGITQSFQPANIMRGFDLGAAALPNVDGSQSSNGTVSATNLAGCDRFGSPDPPGTPGQTNAAFTGPAMLLTTGTPNFQGVTGRVNINNGGSLTAYPSWYCSLLQWNLPVGATPATGNKLARGRTGAFGNLLGTDSTDSNNVFFLWDTELSNPQRHGAGNSGVVPFDGLSLLPYVGDGLRHQTLFYLDPLGLGPLATTSGAYATALTSAYQSAAGKPTAYFFIDKWPGVAGFNPATHILTGPCNPQVSEGTFTAPSPNWFRDFMHFGVANSGWGPNGVFVKLISISSVDLIAPFP